MRAVLIDTGAGNLFSVAKALQAAGLSVDRVDDPNRIGDADAMVLPGQGHFGQVMTAFRERGFEAPVREHLRQQRPFLGICVGLQLLMEGSAEAPEVAGLGILPGRVERFNDRSVSTPHMGWNELEAWGETPLLAGVEAGAHAYFAHSFYVAFDQGATSRATGGAWSQHGHTRFLSAVSLGQLHATQFHPEKSQALGLSILRNFALAAQTAAASAHADG